MTSTSKELSRREMYAEIKQLCKPNNSTNWFWILLEYAVFAATVAVCLAAYRFVESRNLSLWWMAPVYLASVAVIGAWVQNRLSVLVHEASHYSLFKNRKLNDIAANLFLLFPVFGAISNYRTGHWGHHRYVNDPERDPDLHRLAKHKARNFPIPKLRFLWEYVLMELSVHRAISYIKGRALYVAIPMKSEQVKDTSALSKPVIISMRLTYYAVFFSTIAYFNLWLPYILFWIVPFLSFYPAVLFLREIAHHGNFPDDGDFTNSRVYRARWLEREIFFPFGEHNHVLHHMFPTIPHYRMREAHRMMMQYPPYRDTVVICNGFFVKADRNSDDPTVLDILEAPADRYLRRPLADERDIRTSNAGQVGAVNSAS